MSGKSPATAVVFDLSSDFVYTIQLVHDFAYVHSGSLPQPIDSAECGAEGQRGITSPRLARLISASTGGRRPFASQHCHTISLRPITQLYGDR